MEYEFFYSKKSSIHLSNALRLPDADLISIAHVMEMSERYYGSKIRIHSIGIRSDYLSPTAPMRMIHLAKKDQDARSDER